MRPSAQRCFPCPGNTLPGPCRISRRQRCSTFGFTSSARATSPIELPRSSRCTAASLNSLVNILLDNPMTQFSFGWILSLNWLCQKWGQVQLHNTTPSLHPVSGTSPLLRVVPPLGSASVLSPSWFFHLWLLRSHRSPRFPRSARSPLSKLRPP